MPGGLKKFKVMVIWPVPLFEANGWPRDKFKQWVEAAGGQLHHVFGNATTHVVCSEETWRKQGPIIQEALDAKNCGQKIKIVSADWLAEVLNTQKKCKESPYSWEKLDGKAIKKRPTSAQQGKSPAKDDVQANTTKGALTEVFETNTEKFVDPKVLRRLQREQEDRDRVKKELQLREARQREIDKKEHKQLQKAQVALMLNGTKKSRNEIFSDNHHIYMDNTGFSYDVQLTKVDTRNNRNERYNITLQIFESNTEPHTYTTNLHFAGTAKRPRNDILAALGCNFPTAMRAFTKSFKELTHIDWDDRVESYKSRVNTLGQIALQNDFDIGRLPFQYLPPTYGSLGELPRSLEDYPAGQIPSESNQLDTTITNESSPEPVGTDAYDSGERPEYMMSGVRGSSLEPAGIAVITGDKDYDFIMDGLKTSGMARSAPFDSFVADETVREHGNGDHESAPARNISCDHYNGWSGTDEHANTADVVDDMIHGASGINNVPNDSHQMQGGMERHNAPANVYIEPYEAAEIATPQVGDNTVAESASKPEIVVGGKINKQFNFDFGTSILGKRQHEAEPMAQQSKRSRIDDLGTELQQVGYGTPNGRTG